MSHDWVSAVIADLTEYAEMNGLTRTAAALREAADLAALESEAAPPGDPTRRLDGLRAPVGWPKG